MKLLWLIPFLFSGKALCLNLQDSSQSSKQSFITFSLGLSVFNGAFNSYKIGNVEQFYQHLTGRDDIKLDDGALGFKYVAIGFRGSSDKLIVGGDLRVTQTHQFQAIAGTNHGGTGFNVGMNFSATLIETSLIVGPNAGKGCICLEAGFIAGFMSGEINIYSTPNQQYVQKGAMGTGLAVGIHLDHPLGKAFFINMKMGYRLLKIDESHENASGELRTFYVNGQDGETVVVDWSGPYASAGISLALGLKPKKG